MLNIAIVENEKPAADLLQGYLKRYTVENRNSFNITVYEDGISFLSAYAANYDIVFMDIDMPNLNGIVTAKKLREIDDKVILIFVTNLSQYAIKGYEVDAMDYIVKPIIYPAFALKIKKAINRCKKDEINDVYVTTGSGQARFPASSILYVEINGHNIIYHTDSGDYPAYGTMKAVEQQLSAKNFFKCNSCFIVNLRYVKSVNGFIVNVGGYQLSISHRRKKEFMTALHHYYKNGGNFTK